MSQVMPDGTHVTRNVTVGAAQAGETQIVSGVKSGDKVIERVITFLGGAPGGVGGGGIFGESRRWRRWRQVPRWRWRIHRRGGG